jgi:hypothetical protein
MISTGIQTSTRNKNKKNKNQNACRQKNYQEEFQQPKEP